MTTRGTHEPEARPLSPGPTQDGEGGSVGRGITMLRAPPRYREESVGHLHAPTSLRPMQPQGDSRGVELPTAGVQGGGSHSQPSPPANRESGRTPAAPRG